MKKKILIMMEEIGNGHKSPAMAVKKAIEEKFPDKYDVEVIDLFRELNYNQLFDLYKYLWVDLGMKHPWIISFFYKLLDNKLAYKSEEPFLKALIPRIKKYLSKKNPDLILANHESCIHALSMMKSELKTLFIAMNTDPFDAHYVWASPNVDKYIVFSNIAKKILAKKGVDSKKLVVFNSCPLDSKHSLILKSKEVIRKNLGIKSQNTILMFSGAEGVGNLKEFVMSIIENNLNWQVLVVCGRNEALKKELDSLNKGNIKVYGFVDNMPELIQASDIVFGKPGASQTFEVLCKNKPIIYSTYLENEYPTLEFVLNRGFGFYTPTKTEFVKLLRKIEHNPKILENSTRKIKKFKIKSCSGDIAEFINSLII